MIRPALITVLLLFGVAQAQEKKPSSYPAMAPVEQYLIANAQDEIALARSAAPPSISANADVFVLGHHGYEKAVKGSNGFVCLVERSWDAGFENAGFWNPKIRGPNCFNPPAVRSVLPQLLARTEWALAGTDKAHMVDKARAATADHRFVAPEASSFSFMQSKQGYLSDDGSGPWLPHVMFFVSRGQTADWGAGLDGSPVIGAPGLSEFEPSVLYIPVRRWSDGSPAPPATILHQHGS